MYSKELTIIISNIQSALILHVQRQKKTAIFRKMTHSIFFENGPHLHTNHSPSTALPTPAHQSNTRYSIKQRWICNSQFVPRPTRAALTRLWKLFSKFSLSLHRNFFSISQRSSWHICSPLPSSKKKLPHTRGNKFSCKWDVKKNTRQRNPASARKELSEEERGRAGCGGNENASPFNFSVATDKPPALFVSFAL